jgi:DNA helicase-2/ATP-dependent DNA helicase PcrA
MDGQLNESQRAAVETAAGPMLVLAGAGTGKTRVISFRIAFLIKQGIPADRILAVTFTSKAAQEMKLRVDALVRNRPGEKPVISTFHSLCLQILRRHIGQLGYPKYFSIYDTSDQESLARQVLREIHVHDSQLRPRDFMAIMGNWKTHCIRPAQAAQRAENDREHLAATAYRRYQETLKRAGGVDFDDMLLLTEELLGNYPKIRQQEQERFDHILIDEYQDTNDIQYRIVKALAEKHKNICVVGDDDQAIYGFRGGDVGHILNFSRDWPDVVVLRLEDNYRSTAAILDVANSLISHNPDRHSKILRAARPGGKKPRIEQHRDEVREAQWVVADIARMLNRPGIDPCDIAVLFRTREQPRLFETEFRKKKIPYILIGSRSFYDRREVRDILSYLKLVQASSDELALRRIINTPPRGIGAKSVDHLLERATEKGVSLWKVMTNEQDIGILPPATQQACHNLTGMIKGLQHNAQQLGPSGLMQRIIQDIGYESEVARYSQTPEERESRWDTVQEFINAVGLYERMAEEPTLNGFLEETILGVNEADREKEQQLKRNSVVLMTLHAAKGLEYPHVYMVGLEEGILPHHRSLKQSDDVSEERRLAYVGVTRSEETLTLSLSLTRLKWGKTYESHASRFLFEMIGSAEKATDRGGPKTVTANPASRHSQNG